jgi:hypothetical protein
MSMYLSVAQQRSVCYGVGTYMHVLLTSAEMNYVAIQSNAHGYLESEATRGPGAGLLLPFAHARRAALQ